MLRVDINRLVPLLIPVWIGLGPGAALAGPQPPDSVELGTDLIAEGKISQGLEVLRRTARLQPEDVTAHQHLCLVLERTHRLDEALVHCARWLELEKTSSATPLLRSLVSRLRTRLEPYRKFRDHASRQLAQGDEVGAAASFVQASTHLPRATAPHQRLCEVLESTGRLDAAVAHCRLWQARELRPAYRQQALDRISDLQAAIIDAHDPSDPPHRFRTEDADDGYRTLMAEALERMARGQRERAVDALYAATLLRPFAPRLHQRLCAILKPMGRLEAALSHCRQWLAMEPVGGYKPQIRRIINLLEAELVEDGPTRPSGTPPEAALTTSVSQEPTGRAGDEVAPKPPPPVDLPESLSRRQILRVVAKNIQEIRGCRERQPDLSGTVMVNLQIRADGTVSSARVVTDEFEGTPVGACVSSKVAAFHFSQFSGDAMRINLPFSL